MNTIILNGADAELSETEHSPAHRRKHDLLVRNASRQGSAPLSMVLMNGGSDLLASLTEEFAAGHARECCLRTWLAQFIAEHASENRKRNLALSVP